MTPVVVLFLLVLVVRSDLLYEPEEVPEEYDQPSWMLPSVFSSHKQETTTPSQYSAQSEADFKVFSPSFDPPQPEVEEEPDEINVAHPLNTLVPQEPAMTVDRFIDPESIQVELVQCTPDRVILERLLASYNTHKTPSEAGVKVWIEIWLQEVNAINERTSDFEAELYLTEIWVDHALNYEEMKPCRTNLSLSYEVFDKIWKPNTVFINSRSAQIHKSPFPNIFLVIYQNGTVWINERIQVRGPCPDMEFSSFPMDVQTCILTLESFNYNDQEVDMLWARIEKPLLLLKEPIMLPDFILSNYSTFLTKVQYPAGIWNELSFTLTFTRRFGWYGLQAFFPSYLTIFISWLAFCLGHKMIPARTMLGVNSLLALTFQFGNVMRNLPRVRHACISPGGLTKKDCSYIKALDIFMIACLLFVFASLIELAIVGVIANRNEKPVRLKASDSVFSSESSEGEREGEEEKEELKNAVFQTSPHAEETPWISETPKHAKAHIFVPASKQSWNSGAKKNRRYTLPAISKQGFSSFRKWWQRKKRRVLCISTSQIDHFSMIAFPFCFALFNVLYWSYYLTREA